MPVSGFEWSKSNKGMIEKLFDDQSCNKYLAQRILRWIVSVSTLD